MCWSSLWFLFILFYIIISIFKLCKLIIIHSLIPLSNGYINWLSLFELLLSKGRHVLKSIFVYLVSKDEKLVVVDVEDRCRNVIGE
jgi:hypothetical protein